MCYPSRETSIDDFLAEVVELLNCHGRGAKSTRDPDWMDIVGHPTIPHVQSLRAPPAQVAHHSHSEHLIGLTNRNASKRYLEKLQRERERNQEVLTECVDNLPIVIRQVAYPDKPSSHPNTQRTSGVRSFPETSHERYRNEFWQNNIEKWVNDEHMETKFTKATTRLRNGRNKTTSAVHGSRRQTSSQSAANTKNNLINNEYVHYPGFQGSPESQANNLKYKFGKKKPGSANEERQQATTFKPNGFGSLYDELEFERRYKKVFDVNQHIHFVHSNFVSGQRLFKRNKLPPIGHIPDGQPEQMDARDIFAIMSVQRFNHPEEPQLPPQPLVPPRSYGNHNQTQRFNHSEEHPCEPVVLPRTHGKQRIQTYGTISTPIRPARKTIELAQDVNVPVGFIPGTIKTTGNSPFNGVNGQTTSFNMETQDIGYRLSLKGGEDDSAVGTLTEESSQPMTFDDPTNLLSSRSVTSKKTKATDETKQNVDKSGTDNESVDTERTLESEFQPFNISVRVEIKQKDSNINGGDDVENERARELKQPIIEELESSESHENHGTNNVERVLQGKNLTSSTNQYGFVSHRVSYPDKFVLDDSLLEENESELENEINETI